VHEICGIRTAVTDVSDQASKLQVTLMLAEGTMLYGLSHNNVLPVLAASLDSLKQPLLVYPYSNKGNLKRYSQHQRRSSYSESNFLFVFFCSILVSNVSVVLP
jgi:hypothetical protein